MDLRKRILSPIAVLSRIKQRLSKVDKTKAFVLSGADLLFFLEQIDLICSSSCLAGVAKGSCLRLRIILCLLLFDFLSSLCVCVCVCVLWGGREVVEQLSSVLVFVRRCTFVPVQDKVAHTQGLSHRSSEEYTLTSFFFQFQCGSTLCNVEV